MALKRGDTFLMPKSAKAVEHLWIIVTEIDPVSRLAICVNVTTRQHHSDTTVVLVPGDHPFVKHDSVINFSDAREMPIAIVEQALESKISQFVCKPHEPCSEELLQRIRKGLLASKLTPKGIKQKCKELWT